VAARFPERVVVLDGGQERDVVAARVREELAVATG
jgi:hypothetical protein